MEKKLDLQQSFQQGEVEEDVLVGVAVHNPNLLYLDYDLFSDLALQFFSYYLQQIAVNRLLSVLLTGLKKIIHRSKRK